MGARLVLLRAARRFAQFRAAAGRRAIDLVVVHSISLPPGMYGGDECSSLFTNTLDWNAQPYFKCIEGMQVSAHFYVRRDGALWQFVSCDERAWHAGTSLLARPRNCNDDSVGIELEGLEGETLRAEQYRRWSACAPLSRALSGRGRRRHEHMAPGRKAIPARASTGRCYKRSTRPHPTVFSDKNRAFLRLNAAISCGRTLL